MSDARWSAWPAPAKLNLFLRVIGRRVDGYHDLQTVFRLLDWGDEIRLRVRDDGVISRVAGCDAVDVEDDLAVRAARTLQQTTAARFGADIDIDKNIPIGAGLGGGSSDAATVLIALNTLWDIQLSRDELAQIGLQLGADVPVFVHGRSAWAEGVGEKLTPLELPPRWYVILVPHVHVSTAALFQAPELTRNAAPATIPGFVSGGIEDNVFAPVARAHYPQVAAALDALSRFGNARLSGSGGAVFLECGDATKAREVAAQCAQEFVTHVARGVNVSPLQAKLEQHRSGHY